MIKLIKRIALVGLTAGLLAGCAVDTGPGPYYAPYGPTYGGYTTGYNTDYYNNVSTTCGWGLNSYGCGGDGYYY